MSPFQVLPIYSNYDGFATLARLHADCQSGKSITFDLSSTSWLDANMCAPFGAILRKLRTTNNVTVRRPPPSVLRILAKNGFWETFAEDDDKERRPDVWATTIEYREFALSDSAVFREYVSENWRGKGLPPMTPELHREILRSIFELFENAVIHSQSELGVFTCGQYFPNLERLDLSIADLGVGIPYNVERYLGRSLHHAEAIDWAMQGRNTTKTGGTPGGLGLKLLREFIAQNGGKLQVASHNGYWEQGPDRVVVQRELPAPFPGTVVNIEVNTADENEYMLASELSPSDIL